MSDILNLQDNIFIDTYIKTNDLVQSFIAADYMVCGYRGRQLEELINKPNKNELIPCQHKHNGRLIENITVQQLYKNVVSKSAAKIQQPKIANAFQTKLKEYEASTIADATEILQFYTSVMRGQVLDQFGIEASLDTRIKAARELASIQIELPQKLKVQATQNNIGSININLLPRKELN